MEIDGKTGLIIAAVAGGAALLLGKKSKTAKCPAGSTLDVASGMCVAVRTVEKEVVGPSGDQTNRGGASQTAKDTYTLNEAALALWNKRAAALSEDAKATTEFGALMTLIQASTMFPDTPAGKASLVSLQKRIDEAFARIDAARVRNAELSAEVAFGADRKALATKYLAAMQTANGGFTEYSNALKATFLASKDVVNTYLDKKYDVLAVAQTIADSYKMVAGVIHDPSAGRPDYVYEEDKLPSLMFPNLPSVDVFSRAADKLSSITPSSTKTDIVLKGMPRLNGQLTALFKNFTWYNTWGAIAAGLRNVADPVGGADQAAEMDYLAALGRGMGTLYCGRAVAVMAAVNVLSSIEKAINNLEITARLLDIGNQTVNGAVAHARSVEQTVNNGDNGCSSTTMRKTIDALSSYKSNGWRAFTNVETCLGGHGDYPEGKTQGYIQQYTDIWLRSYFYGLPLSVSTVMIEQLKRIPNGPSAATPQDMFRTSSIGEIEIGGVMVSVADSAALQTQLTSLFDLLNRWTKAINIVDVDYALDDLTAPNSAQIQAAGLDLSLVANCFNVTVPFTPRDYKTMKDGPVESSVVRNPGSVEDDIKIAGTRDALRSEWSASFAGLRGLRGLNACTRGVCAAPRGSRVAVRESTVGRTVMRAVPRAQRPSIVERVVVRGSGLGSLGRYRNSDIASDQGSVSNPRNRVPTRRNSLGGLGRGLGDPIQSILSPLMGLNGRKGR